MKCWHSGEGKGEHIDSTSKHSKNMYQYNNKVNCNVKGALSFIFSFEKICHTYIYGVEGSILPNIRLKYDVYNVPAILQSLELPNMLVI